MYLWDAVNERQLDVFLDQVEMCHRIDLGSRLDADESTLTFADLLLMKLQIVETNRRTISTSWPCWSINLSKDSAGIDLAYLAALAADDWGLWKTTTTVAERAAGYAAGLDDFEKTDHVRAQLNRYLQVLEEAPKSRRWKLRDKIGERRRWYELPEESH